MATVLAAAEAVISHAPDPKEPIRAPFAQLALLFWAALPLVAPVNSNLNVIVTAALAVYIGCCRSVKSTDAPTEGAMTTAVSSLCSPAPTPALSLHPTSPPSVFAQLPPPSFEGLLLKLLRSTWQDALKFPLLGSAVLLGLFVVFKLFDRDLVNLLLTAYFVVCHPLLQAASAMSVPRRELVPLHKGS